MNATAGTTGGAVVKNLGPPCVTGAPTPIKANSGEVARLAVQVSQVGGKRILLKGFGCTVLLGLQKGFSDSFKCCI